MRHSAIHDRSPEGSGFRSPAALCDVRESANNERLVHLRANCRGASPAAAGHSALGNRRPQSARLAQSNRHFLEAASQRHRFAERRRPAHVLPGVQVALGAIVVERVLRPRGRRSDDQRYPRFSQQSWRVAHNRGRCRFPLRHSRPLLARYPRTTNDRRSATLGRYDHPPLGRPGRIRPPQSSRARSCPTVASRPLSPYLPRLLCEPDAPAQFTLPCEERVVLKLAC